MAPLWETHQRPLHGKMKSLGMSIRSPWDLVPTYAPGPASFHTLPLRARGGDNPLRFSLPPRPLLTLAARAPLSAISLVSPPRGQAQPQDHRLLKVSPDLPRGFPFPYHVSINPENHSVTTFTPMHEPTPTFLPPDPSWFSCLPLPCSR